MSSTTPRLPWFSNSNTGLPSRCGVAGEGAAGRIATAALDLDHLGAPVAHHRRGAGRGDVGGELDDLQSCKQRGVSLRPGDAILGEAAALREAAEIPSDWSKLAAPVSGCAAPAADVRRASAFTALSNGAASRQVVEIFHGLQATVDRKRAGAHRIIQMQGRPCRFVKRGHTGNPGPFGSPRLTKFAQYTGHQAAPAAGPQGSTAQGCWSRWSKTYQSST